MTHPTNASERIRYGWCERAAAFSAFTWAREARYCRGVASPVRSAAGRYSV